MLVIRFLRAGKKNQPFFKIVVVEKEKSSTSGLFTEDVGFYNPLTKEKSLKADRIKYWISVGAKPSFTVHNLLVSEKVIEGKKIDVHKKPKEKKEKETSSEAAPSAQETEHGKPEEIQAEPAKEPAEQKKPAEAPKEEKPEEAKAKKETAADAEVSGKEKNSSEDSSST